MHVETRTVSDLHSFYNNSIKGERDENKRIPRFDTLGLVKLPSYEEINHKDIMSFYVKEFVDDKEIRKTLFYILRNRDYYDKLIDKIKEYGLSEDYLLATNDIYNQIAREWLEENNIIL